MIVSSLAISFYCQRVFPLVPQYHKKAKIWSNEFFDIRVLLSHQKEEPFMRSLNLGVIKGQHTMQSKTPMFISLWTNTMNH